MKSVARMAASLRSGRDRVREHLEDAYVACRLVRGAGRAPSEAARLDAFYGPQARTYDRFRARLLRGRSELLDRLPFAEGVTWVDFGGGTASLLELAGNRLAGLSTACVVDLSGALLDIGRVRTALRGWRHVHLVQGDAVTAELPVSEADLVTFSYSLTMMPAWFAAIDRAWRLLRPGGAIGVVDFFVSAKHVAPGRARHGWLTRTGWPLWFGWDDVVLNPDHLEFLEWRFATVYLDERRTPLPMVPLARAPYYMFVGRKR
jgi:S-adenosylmethionine-diacylgycerolhomoserine-N-methlytransferase